MKWIDDISPLAAALAVLTVLAAAFGVTLSIYTSGRDYGQHPTVDHPREGKIRHAVGQECRQVDDVVGSVESLDGWTVRVCEGAGCARTDGQTRTVWVPPEVGDVARHEIVHGCLFAAGWPGESHHSWMRTHCSFCWGSPSCVAPCLQTEDDE